nr:helix-hairpin-helix domain-containing protein [Halorubellus salinus]
MEVVVDDESERIRAAVEPIPGVGETLSRYLAERYGSLEELREADLEELRSIPDVGEQRAEAIKSRLSR